MPLITIYFPNPLNVSVQIGDMAYYMKQQQTLGTHQHSQQGDIVQIGPIVSIGTDWITCDWSPNPIGSPWPTNGMFIMFSKDNKANLSSILGYYAEVKFTNNSPNEAELFSVGTEIFESSK